MEKMSTSDQHELKIVIDMIKEVVHPYKIILFGSFAKGEETKLSDFDLVVVHNQPQTKRDLYKAIKMGLMHRKLSRSQDILLFKEDDFEEKKQWNHDVCWRANKEGKVVYEAPK